MISSVCLSLNYTYFGIWRSFLDVDSVSIWLQPLIFQLQKVYEKSPADSDA